MHVFANGFIRFQSDDGVGGDFEINIVYWKQTQNFENLCSLAFPGIFSKRDLCRQIYILILKRVDDSSYHSSAHQLKSELVFPLGEPMQVGFDVTYGRSLAV